MIIGIAIGSIIGLVILINLCRYFTRDEEHVVVTTTTTPRQVNMVVVVSTEDREAQPVYGDGIPLATQVKLEDQYKIRS